MSTVINENNQIWINFSNWVSHCSSIIEYLITDHLPMFYVFSKQEYVNRKQIKHRLINQSNMLSFIDDFNNYDFTDIYSAQDPDTAFTLFYNTLYNLYRDSFPVKKKRFRRGRLSEPWVSPLLKRCIKKKFRLYNLLKRGIISRNTFNKYKKVLSIITKKIRLQYYKIKFYSCENDSRKTWKNINILMNRKVKCGIDKVCDSTGNFICGKDMSNHFNDISLILLLI